MRQQINLYQDGLMEKKAPLHAGAMGGFFAVCVLVIGLATVVLSWQQGKLEDDLGRLKQEQVMAAARLQVLKLENPARQQDPLLAQQLKRKQQELAGRKPLLAYLNNFDLGQITGFSPVIKGLAEHPLQGVWLTWIRLNNSKQKVFLAGSALQADLIPAYVRHLGENKVLAGQNFARLKVTRTKEKRQQVDFILESDLGAADE